MTTKRELWRTQLARPEQLPPETYDIWTLWCDRGWGATRAALEEALRLADTTTHTPMGPRPGRIGVFTDGRDQEAVILQMLSEDIRVEGMGRRMIATTPTGGALHFFRYDRPEQAQGLQLDHFLLDGIELASAQYLDLLYRMWNQAGRYSHGAAHLVQTCHVMPRMPLNRVAGVRRHLTIGSDAAENTALSDAQLAAIRDELR